MKNCMSLRIVILAAGQSKRMQSNLPKVLHPLAGKPLLHYVIEVALKLSTLPPIVVYGHHGKQVQQAFSQLPVAWVEQAEQKGTGHALLQALPLLQDEKVLILCGDVPLVSLTTLQQLIKNTPQAALGLITATLPDPSGYGRIVRNQQQAICGIVEEKDADDKIRALKEINSGIYYVAATDLKRWLSALSTNNAQGEYYLTDIIALALKEGRPIHSEHPGFIEEVLGINDRLQLNHLERFYQRQQAQKLLQQGVTLADPARFDLRGELIVGRDVSIDINVIIEGRVVIGDGCYIGPHVYLRDSTLGKDVSIRSHSVIDGADIAAASSIGPFARIRPGTVLATKVHIGNFVEIKNSYIDAESKVNHLSYIGDSHLGKKVNIGAGTITCNYDGFAKHKTIIHDGAFIGSGTELVAPVTIGQGATIGAGSTITKDAPAQQLTLARAQQKSIAGWKKASQKINSSHIEASQLDKQE